MKDFIAVAFALTVASTSGVSRSDVMSAMKTANNDPEALATNLLQYGEANTDRDSNDCADMTGYEHCTKCAMPSIQKLVTALVAVKNEAWTDQKTITDQAANVCNSANPSDRYGGNAKCCSASVTASLYAPSGFAGCTQATFSPESAEPTAESMGTMGGAHADSNVKYNRDHGFYFEASGAITPSSMVQDCCTSTSTCRANEGTLSTTVATAIAELNTAKEGIEGAIASKKATTMEIALEHAKLVRTNAGIKKICQAADHTDADFDEGTPSAMPVANDDTATITSKCPGDCQIKTIVERQAVRKAKIAAHTASVVRTKAIITKVIEWLDADTNGDGSARIFDSHSNDRSDTLLKNGVEGADGYDSSVALLESATKQTTNAASLASLQKATSLLQGVGRDGGTGTGGISKVLELLRQIELDFTNQITQLGVYSQQMDTEEDTDLANMRDQIVDLEAERTAAIAQEVALQDKISTFDNDIQTKYTEVGTKMSEWKSAYEARETNAKKCSIFMTFFDSETVVNTEELLVLKKAIDIIKHITCGTSQAPTAAPTAFPTAAPNADPTAFPTRSPTAAPTAPPSVNASTVVAEACVATHTYRFMQDVYTNPDKYAVPSYTDGIRYSIPLTADGACQTIETSHTNVEGAVQTIEHEYKCCDGSYYGAISYDDAANSLCGLAAADHCGLFGANMYYGDKDPSAPCPSACDIESCDDWAMVDGTCHTEAELATNGDTAGSHADCTGCATTKAHQAKLSGIGITLAPTTAPTAYPTRTPTASPTAAANVTVVHRTDAPTAAPTAFPTAVHHEGRDVELLTDGTDQGNMSKHDAGKYNITKVSLDETAAPTGFPTAYPTASPTESPTAYPTAAPTPAPTEAPTPAPTNIPANWVMHGTDIDGEAAGDRTGGDVSLSADGFNLAVYGGGHVRVYYWGQRSAASGDYGWMQRGDDLDVQSNYGTVRLSQDGKTVAFADHGQDYAGRVRIFTWSPVHFVGDVVVNGAWEQRGADIHGEAASDTLGSGNAISLSLDGQTVAIGATGNDGAGNGAGHVRIYRWAASSWVQLGDDIDGEAAGDGSGKSVSLSADGQMLAIGATGNDGAGLSAGHVRVYTWGYNPDLSDRAWEQRGDDIDGEAARDQSGLAVSLSSDGSTVAIGAHGSGGAGDYAGHVRIYTCADCNADPNYNSQYGVGTKPSQNGWLQRGEDIDGEQAWARSGSAVSLSTNGQTVAIGATQGAGYVRIYSWAASSWVQRGADIDGEAAGDEFGSSISLSGDGQTVAIGAGGHNANTGRVRVYTD